MRARQAYRVIASAAATALAVVAASHAFPVSADFAAAALPLPLCMATGPYWCSDIQVDDASVAASTARVEVGDSSSVAASVAAARMRLEGHVRYAVEPFNGQHLQVSAEDAAAGRYERRLQVVLPHSEDDLYGCSPLAHPTTDEGDLVAGSFLLLQRRGGCVFQPKMAAAEGAGAAVAAIYNCDACDDEVVRMANNDVQAIPGVFLAKQDGQLMREYLLARRAAFVTDPAYSGNFSAPLYVVLNGTGPLVPAELTALTTMAQHLQLMADDLASTSQLRPWTDLLLEDEAARPDPCLDRIAGVYCESGHVHSIFLRFLGVNGTLHESVGQLTRMQFLSISENDDNGGLTDSIPSTLCALRGLRSLELTGNLFTSIPDCLGADQPLQVLSVDRNQLPSLPASISQAAASLVKFTAASNALTALPPALSSLVQMRQLDLSNHPALGASINVSTDLRFDAWTQLTDWSMSSCGLRGDVWPQMFDGCSMLQRVELADNQLTGDLPQMAGASLRVEGAAPLSGALWSFSTNVFTGGVPTTWATAGTASVALDHNALVGPLDPLGLMEQLAYLRLDSNQIALRPEHDGLIDVLIFSIVGTSLVELYLSNNLLEGDWEGTLLSSTPALTVLALAYNRIAAVPQDVFDSKITILDMSHNQLSGDLPSNINTAPPYVSSLSFQGNSALVAWPLPTWLKFVEPAVWLPADDSGSFECRSLTTPTANAASFHIEVDPIFTQYQGCRCARGRFGDPPLCDRVPVQASLFPFGALVVSNETSLQAANPSFFRNLMVKYDDGGNSSPGAQELGVNCSTVYTADWATPDASSSLAVNTSSAVVSPWPSSFTDQWYGTNRLTVGLSTFWRINLRRLRRDTITDVQSANHDDVSHLTIGGDARLQPVRQITVRLHISGAAFNGAGNQLVIYEGVEQALGPALLTVSSDNVQALAQLTNKTSLAYTGAYQCRYGSSLAQLVAPVFLVEVEVPSNSASVYFSSRDVTGAHFVATYSQSYTCPSGLELSSSNECVTPGTPSNSMVAIIISVAGVLLLLSIGWVVRERYLRERREANSALEAHQASDCTEEDGEMESRLVAALHLAQVNNIKREMAQQILSFCLETVLLISSWVSSMQLVLHTNEEDDRVAVAYLTCSIMSLMAYLLVTTTRVVQVQHLVRALATAHEDGAAEDLSFQMGVLQRRLLQLSIVSVALLFDSVPMLVLNLYRSSSTSLSRSANARFLFQSFLGSFLLGVKVLRLAEGGRIKRRLLQVQLNRLGQLELRKRTSTVHAAKGGSYPELAANPALHLRERELEQERIASGSILSPFTAPPREEVELQEIRTGTGLANEISVHQDEEAVPPPPSPQSQPL